MKLFVWDFHGVLEKDNDLAVREISNRVLEQAGYDRRLSEAENADLYGLKWYQYFERLLPELSHEQHLELQAACFAFAEGNLDVLAKHIRPTEHSVEVLRTIHEAGHDQIILSNTRPHDLLWFAQTVGIDSYFQGDRIIGVNAHQKHGDKSAALTFYLEGKTFDDVIIIGDSQGDMELQRVAGGTTYFYYHPHLTIPTPVVADHVIRDLRSLLVEV